MKRFIKIFSALTMVILILAVSVIPSFAAADLTVNGETAKKGDVITYDLMLGDCSDRIAGFHIFINYDDEYLKVVDDSLNFYELNSQVIANPNSEDGIIFVYSHVDPDEENMADFSVQKMLATVEFEVLKGGETNIEFFVTDLFGIDMTYMKSYTFTYNLSVNDQPVIEGEPPLLVTDQEFLNENQGQFINYVDGKGEENGNADDNAIRETVMGVTTAPATDVLKGTEASSSMDLTTVIVMIAVVLIVLIIIVLVIVRNALNRSKKEEADASAATETTEKNEE